MSTTDNAEPTAHPPGSTRWSRRAALIGMGSVLLACGPTTRPAPTQSSPAGDATQAELAALETGFGGRLGVFGIDTGTGRMVRHRADEPFLMCSTYKLLAVAAILHACAAQPTLPDRVIPYDRAQLVPYSPVTAQHVGEGMTVSALCQAALTRSDNTAANLLLRVLGGPPAVTRFVRTLGDPVTRLDRTEPTVNEPGGALDTTTPARIAEDLRALTLGDALDPPGRDQLIGWLTANTTGGRSIRAGIPASWRVGDKTGSGERGEVNDVGVIWPPGRPPLIMAVYTAPADPHSAAGYPTVAQAAVITAQALVPGGVN